MTPPPEGINPSVLVVCLPVIIVDAAVVFVLVLDIVGG
jgi:hypothetical protein